MKKSAVSALAICTEKCDNRRNKRGVSMKKSLDFTRFLSVGFHQTLENIGRNAL